MEPETLIYVAAIESAMGSAVPAFKISAIDYFIFAEKVSGRWSLHNFIWFPVWGNATADSICLKTGIMQGSYPNGATHSSDGYVMGNGSSQYFDSGKSSSTYLGVSSTHIFSLVLESPQNGTLYGVGQNEFDIISTDTSGMVYELSGIMGHGHDVTETDTSGMVYELSGIMGDSIFVSLSDNTGAIWNLAGELT